MIATATSSVLWRSSSAHHRQVGYGASISPGPKRRLAEDDVLESALGTLDLLGVEKLNVRAVAEQLAVSPGALYTYVASKQELLDRMLAHTLRSVNDSRIESGGWRAEVRGTIVAIHQALDEHPGAVQLLLAGVGSPDLDAARNRVLQVLADAGVPLVARVRALTMLVSYAVGEVAVTRLRGGARRAAELERRRGLPPEDFPRLVEAAGVAVDREGGGGFVTGLEALLDAVEAMRTASDDVSAAERG